jgi:hypothetical protein
MERDPTAKASWETPETVALTDADSRADQPDVAMRNGAPSGSTSL